VVHAQRRLGEAALDLGVVVARPLAVGDEDAPRRALHVHPLGGGDPVGDLMPARRTASAADRLAGVVHLSPRAAAADTDLDRLAWNPLERLHVISLAPRFPLNHARIYSAGFMANDTIQSQAPTQLDDSNVWTTGPDGEQIPNYDATFPEINEGQVVHGQVVRVDKDEVLVDIGYKSEGVIPVSELSIRRSVNPEDEVKIGDEIDALVLTKEDADGRLILSKKRARFEIAWKAIEGAAETGEAVTGRVIEVVKGGLILDLGVRGFLPASLVDIRRVQDLDEFLGQELRCKVIELNRSRNNVVLSRRAVLEDERKEMRQAILDRLNPGDVVEGQISNIVDFGAFVDLDGMDGLIHISELSWSHVNHPSEVLEIGQDVKVKVLDIDRERQRISLGLKQTQSDPWQQVTEAYNENDVVQGKVTKVVTFGAFVEILPGVEGLVHISELAQHHVENPREVVSQGDVVNVKIIEVDADRRRLSLSLKRVEDAEEVQPRADGQPLETPAPPQIDLSDEVFAETRSGEEAAAEDLAEEPATEAAAEASEDPESVSTPDIPAGEPDLAPEQADHSIEADAVAPEHQGPGDSEGAAPAPPPETEER
jgi:small subunit ribosomal protein S1